jgi:hypothetical protein
MMFFFLKSFIKIISLGPHTISVLFNRIPIPETPLRVFVELKEIKKVSDEFIEERKYQTDQPTHTHTSLLVIGNHCSSTFCLKVGQKFLLIF